MKEVKVIRGKKRAWRLFRDEDVAEEFFEMCLEHFGKGVDVYLISRTKAIPPPRGYRHPTNTTLWCPCCGDERKFLMDNDLGCIRCEICGISENHAYVKTYNHRDPGTTVVKTRMRRKPETPLEAERRVKREKRKARREAKLGIVTRDLAPPKPNKKTHLPSGKRRLKLR